jgi:hypothetical protein
MEYEECDECGEQFDRGCFGFLHCPNCEPCMGCFDGGFYDEDDDLDEEDEDEYLPACRPA